MVIYLSPRIHLRRLHPIRAAALIRVALRDSDHLPVGGLQVEVVLAVLARVEFELGHEDREEVPVVGDLIRKTK